MSSKRMLKGGVGVFEDAGQVSVRDAAIPFATFTESLKQAFISGNREQLKPVISHKHRMKRKPPQRLAYFSAWWRISGIGSRCSVSR
jgi:hypothetical protein